MFIENLDTFYTQLGTKIKTARKEVGMNQEDLAYQLGLTRTSVVNIENGKQRPAVHILILAAKILKVEFSYLFDITPQTSRNESIHDIKIVWDNIITTATIKSTTKKDLTNLIRSENLDL